MNKLMLAMTILSLFSCGPSKEELARRQKAHEDSIRNAITEKFARIASLKDSLASAETFLRKTSDLLVFRRADLAASRDKLIQIKGFQFLRTETEREQQIRNQTIAIEKLEIEVRKLSIRIDNGELVMRNLKARLSKLQ